MSEAGRPTDPIEVIDKHEEIFKKIRDEAEDPEVAERYGEKPLKLLELDRRQGDRKKRGRVQP
jgi:hypothetical protein